MTTSTPSAQVRRRALVVLVAAVAIGFAAPGSAQAAQKKSAQAPPAAPAHDYSKDEVHLLKVQGNIHMLVGAGGNITVQVGDDGVLLVDTGLAPMADKVLAAIHSLTDKPIRYIINTHFHADHTGGNETIAKAGMTIAGGNVVGDIGASAANQAAVYAFQTVLDRMSAANGNDRATPQGAWPTEVYTTPERKMFFDDEGIVMFHIPNAHTDGDTMVFFRRSDVISTGDIFVTNGYPFIDIDHGGNIQGELDGLNKVIELAIPKDLQEDGTLVIPGHGRLCDVADVVFYQEMVTIIRDRVKNLIGKGMTLEQVKAVRPTRDYDPRYGTRPGSADRFVEAIYKSLSAKH
jgi:cyclase